MAEIAQKTSVLAQENRTLDEARRPDLGSRAKLQQRTADRAHANRLLSEWAEAACRIKDAES